MSLALLALAVALNLAPSAWRTRTRLVDRAEPRRWQERTGEPGLLGAAFCLDVLAVCLRSGMPVSTAVLAVAPAGPPELARLLRRAGELLVLGSSPATAWSDVEGATGPEHEHCRTLARLARRSADSGATMADGIGELAAQCRRDAADSAMATAERAGVLIGAPLGLCFLPSFVCLGIVPVVMGLAADVFGDGVL
jgi:pilus assembly protein TadC